MGCMVARIGIALYWLIAAGAAVVALGAVYIFFREGFIFFFREGFIFALPIMGAAAAIWLVGRAIRFALARQ